MLYVVKHHGKELYAIKDPWRPGYILYTLEGLEEGFFRTEPEILAEYPAKTSGLYLTYKWRTSNTIQNLKSEFSPSFFYLESCMEYPDSLTHPSPKEFFFSLWVHPESLRFIEDWNSTFKVKYELIESIGGRISGHSGHRILFEESNYPEKYLIQVRGPNNRYVSKVMFVLLRALGLQYEAIKYRNLEQFFKELNRLAVYEYSYLFYKKFDFAEIFSKIPEFPSERKFRGAIYSQTDIMQELERSVK